MNGIVRLIVIIYDAPAVTRPRAANLTSAEPTWHTFKASVNSRAILFIAAELQIWPTEMNSQESADFHV
jgi:hypothetical protein